MTQMEFVRIFVIKNLFKNSSYLVFIHNHKLNFAIQLDLKGNEENMEPKELQ